jgi:hypothetical protein
MFADPLPLALPRKQTELFGKPHPDTSRKEPIGSEEMYKSALNGRMPNSRGVLLRRETCGSPLLKSLRLLGMERDLLSLKVADQIPGSIDRDLIIDREQNPPVSLERLVDFRTLFTHCCRPVSGGCNVATARFTTISAAFCFNGTAAIRSARTVAGRPSGDLRSADGVA